MFPLLPFDLIVIISFWPSLSVKGTLDLKHILPLSNLERGSTVSCAVTVTVQLKGRCWAVMKMWKLCHTDVFECGERQTMSHLTTCGDAPNSTWEDLAIPTLVPTVPNTNTGMCLFDRSDRGLHEEVINWSS